MNRIPVSVDRRIRCKTSIPIEIPFVLVLHGCLYLQNVRAKQDSSISCCNANIQLTVQFIEVDATKILEGDQEDITPKKKNVEPVSVYPQLLPPAQQSQDQTWRAARTSEGLHALSDAAAADEERTLYPHDLTLWDYDDDDDPDDDDYAPEQDLLPLAQHQQQSLQQRQRGHMNMQADDTQEYNDDEGDLDFFLEGVTTHASDHIDPDLERITAGALDQTEVKFDGLSEEDMEWLRSQQPVEDVTKG